MNDKPLLKYFNKLNTSKDGCKPEGDRPSHHPLQDTGAGPSQPACKRRKQLDHGVEEGEITVSVNENTSTAPDTVAPCNTSTTPNTTDAATSSAPFNEYKSELRDYIYSQHAE